jgi:hypothetical protein
MHLFLELLLGKGHPVTDQRERKYSGARIPLYVEFHPAVSHMFEEMSGPHPRVVRK